MNLCKLHVLPKQQTLITGKTGEGQRKHTHHYHAHKPRWQQQEMILPSDVWSQGKKVEDYRNVWGGENEQGAFLPLSFSLIQSQRREWYIAILLRTLYLIHIHNEQAQNKLQYIQTKLYSINKAKNKEAWLELM